MKEVQVTLINKLGLHARASAKFVSTAAGFQSKLEISKDNQTINGKSIMGVMMLAAKCGSVITLHMDGPDELKMETALLDLIAQRFHEEE
ncbi:MAG: HPr family phosphocarrier protein [Gammaproteobacteria bacterium]|nr:HPr family phosphocarrier protein [Gammaproteobacteria bacterium]